MSGLCEYKPGRKVKSNSILQMPWYESESGVKAGPKQDPKTFKSSSNLDIKVKFNRRLVWSSFFFWVRFLRQEIGFSEYLSSGLCCKLVRDRNWTWERLVHSRCAFSWGELFTSSGYELFLVPVQKRPLRPSVALVDWITFFLVPRKC